MRLKCLYSFLFICFIWQSVFSQITKTYTIRPGEKVTSIIPLVDQYMYANFQNGSVLFKNGYKSKALLNYYIISQELHFITKNSDTLAISNPAEISNVVIGNDYFFYEGSCFVKQDTVIGEITIALSFFFGTKDIKKITAFGSAADGGVDSYELFLPSTNNKLSITPQVLTTLAIGKSLFIGNKYKNFVPVTKKNIFSLFAEKERILRKYLSDKTVNYYSRKDVVNLLIYMNQQ